MRNNMADKFTQLVQDLQRGDLTLTHIQSAYRTYLRRREDLPDGIKGLLCGEENTGGLVGQQFSFISKLVGNLELAYRRGEQSPEVDLN